ncbi:hypothetical protein DLM78_06680 [Leptospira stimsonii]|uniref:Uncharacterized protein n=1 Tax=Leptospira stimsonii TaxID=2202203 RepID=A0A8B3CWN1_9LEPT|nr:hypothetical protein DLM78_06680 [Leptospira stimsonii]
MEVSLEELNQIEKRFRNYIFILDFLLRETRSELLENRAKREIWLERHENWKKNRSPINSEGYPRIQNAISKDIFRQEFRPLQPLRNSKLKSIFPRTGRPIEFRPLSG